jgi:hypothetical protein
MAENRSYLTELDSAIGGPITGRTWHGDERGDGEA